MKIIRDKNTSISQGYGFIEFESNDTAKFVMDSLNGKGIPNSNKIFKLNWASFGANNSKSSHFTKNDHQTNSNDYSVLKYLIIT